MAGNFRIATAIVEGGNDFQSDALQNRSERIDLLHCLVKHLSEFEKNTCIDLLLLPAGFFTCLSRSEISSLSNSIASSISDIEPSFDIVWGIDVCSENGKSCKKRGGSIELPFFASCRSRSGELVTIQQISSSAEEGRSENLLLRFGKRDLFLPNSEIALLICGECWSDKFLSLVESKKSKALIVPAHQAVNLHRKPTGWGRASWHLRLKKFEKRSGIPVILAEHTRSRDRHNYSWGYLENNKLQISQRLSSMFTVRVATFKYR